MTQEPEEGQGVALFSTSHPRGPKVPKGARFSPSSLVVSERKARSMKDAPRVSGFSESLLSQFWTAEAFHAARIHAGFLRVDIQTWEPANSPRDSILRSVRAGNSGAPRK